MLLVSLASQVMSGTVAAVIYMHSTAGSLPQEAYHTAEFVHQVCKLFDCIQPYDFKKVLWRVSSNSCHMEFIGEIIRYLKSFEICTPPRVHIHSIADDWLNNFVSLQALWQGVTDDETTLNVSLKACKGLRRCLCSSTWSIRLKKACVSVRPDPTPSAPASVPSEVRAGKIFPPEYYVICYWYQYPVIAVEELISLLLVLC